MCNRNLRNTARFSWLISVLIHGILFFVLSSGQPGEVKRSPVTVELAYAKEVKSEKEVERPKLRKLRLEKPKTLPLLPPVKEPQRPKMEPENPAPLPLVKALEAKEYETKEADPISVPAIKSADIDAPPAVIETAFLGKEGGSGTGGAGTGMATGGPVSRGLGEEGGPSFHKKVMPLYPGFARRLHREGFVRLQVLIDREGKAVKVRIIEKAGYGFDEAAKEAILESTFYPATENGIPVLCLVEIPVRFVLTGSS